MELDKISIKESVLDKDELKNNSSPKFGVDNNSKNISNLKESKLLNIITEVKQIFNEENPIERKEVISSIF